MCTAWYFLSFMFVLKIFAAPWMRFPLDVTDGDTLVGHLNGILEGGVSMAPGVWGYALYIDGQPGSRVEHGVHTEGCLAASLTPINVTKESHCPCGWNFREDLPESILFLTTVLVRITELVSVYMLFLTSSTWEYSNGHWILFMNSVSATTLITNGTIWVSHI